MVGLLDINQFLPPHPKHAEVNFLRDLAEAETTKGVKLWIILTAAVASLLGLVIIFGLGVFIVRRRKKKKSKQKLEDQVFEYERDRAQRMLYELKKMNRGSPRANKQMQNQPNQNPNAAYYNSSRCPHGNSNPPPDGTMLSTEAPICSICYPGQVVVHHYEDPQGLTPGPVSILMQEPIYDVDPMGRYGDYYEDDEDAFEVEEDMPRMRQADSASEMPSTPPPIAPPGFKAVPMVIEKR